jgi:tetratricopeptide (TPR) repeat protein
MTSKVLWELDNELSGAVFERICIDLLYRSGYVDIVPIEPQDGGRDAEEYPRKGRAREGRPAFFQFSLEKNWKSKLRRDAKKLISRQSEFDSFVFVTSQKARGVDVDALKKEFRVEFGWILTVYSREWLRLQLEEAHPDLAMKYLGVDESGRLNRSTGVIALDEPPDQQLRQANQLLAEGNYDLALVTVKGFLAIRPDSAAGWQMLAWSYYKSDRFDEALAAVNRAAKLGRDEQTASIRGCILAEKGIRDADKSSLLEAQRIFKFHLDTATVSTWYIFYNLGNVLGALGQHHAAIEHYQSALQLDCKQPTVWKNLASAYHLIGEHEEELKCFDKALELAPQQPEALISKGVSLIIDFQRAEDAIPVLELALTFSPATVVRWPHIFYWLAFAHRKLGKLHRALEYAEQGLAQDPGDRATQRLMSQVLRALWSSDPSVGERARRFWKNQLAVQPLDFDTRRQLIEAEISANNSAGAWDLIDESFRLFSIKGASSLRSSTFTPEDCLTSLQYLPKYARFRANEPLSTYWDIEDSLYDLKFSPPQADLIEAHLLSYLAIPFGKGWHALEINLGTKENPEVLVHFFDLIRDAIRTATTQAARGLASLVPSKEEGPNAIAKKVTELMMFIGLVALREFGRQRGFIMGYFGVTQKTRDRAMKGYDENKLHTDVLTETFRVLNEETGMLPH